MRTLIITHDLITKTKDHICKTKLMWRELRLAVSSFALLFEDYIVHQMVNIVDGLADKNKYHIESAYQDGKCSERIYSGVTNFKQSQLSQIKSNDMKTNSHVKLKTEQINNESKRKLKQKR